MMTNGSFSVPVPPPKTDVTSPVRSIALFAGVKALEPLLKPVLPVQAIVTVSFGRRCLCA